MALPSPTSNMCIQFSNYLFSDAYRIFTQPKRKFRKISVSTNAWVWVYLFSFFSSTLCFNFATFVFRRICFHLFCLFFGTWELPTLSIHSKIFKRSCMGSIPFLRNGTWRTIRTFANYQILEYLSNVMFLSTTVSAQNFSNISLRYNWHKHPHVFFSFKYFCPFPSIRTALKNRRKA